MNRERAIDLAEHLLRNLDDGQETWPLSLVTAVYVFGSFARGALTPGDLDIDVEKTSDEQWSRHFVQSLSAGRDPFIPLRKALTTGRRGYQFVLQYRDMAGRDFEMTLLWKRGDTLDAAMKRLHAIQIDPAAGRAERTPCCRSSRALTTGYRAPTGRDSAQPSAAERSALSALSCPTDR